MILELYIKDHASAANFGSFIWERSKSIILHMFEVGPLSEPSIVK